MPCPSYGVPFLDAGALAHGLVVSRPNCQFPLTPVPSLPPLLPPPPDLLTKKWEAKKSDFNNKFSVKSESQKVTVTSTVTAEDDSSKQLGGKVNVTYKDKAVGEFSTEGSTDGSYKTTAKLTKLKPGATVSGETTCARKGVSGKVIPAALLPVPLPSRIPRCPGLRSLSSSLRPPPPPAGHRRVRRRARGCLR